MKKVSLEKLFEKPLSGEWGIEDSGKGIATPVIRTANFLNSGKLNLDNIVYREIDKTKYDSKLLKFGDIIIEKSGGSPNQPVGRVVYFDIVEKEYFTNNFTSILRPKSDNNSKYVFYLMRHLYDTRKVLKFQNQTTGIINLKLSDYLKQTVVKLSSNINEQNKIVNILDKLDNKILLRQEQLKELSNVIKSRFIEFFGHPETNEKGWKINTFADICTVRQGLQIPISKRLTEYEENCYEYITVQYLHGGKEQEYIKCPKSTVICNKEDILMTRTGNTGMVVTGVDGVFHNNFFLIDFDRNRYDKNFLVQYLNLDIIQTDIRRRAGTSTIPDLNHSEFYKIPVFEPPIELQIQFNNFIKQVDKSQLAIKKSLEELETLKKSLMQAYFG